MTPFSTIVISLDFEFLFIFYLKKKVPTGISISEFLVESLFFQIKHNIKKFIKEYVLYWENPIKTLIENVYIVFMNKIQDKTLANSVSKILCSV